MACSSSSMAQSHSGQAGARGEEQRLAGRSVAIQKSHAVMPGDAEKQVEYRMLAENDPGFPHAEVLKPGHHGSENSTMPEFLAAVGARISIISSARKIHTAIALPHDWRDCGVRRFSTSARSADAKWPTGQPARRQSRWQPDTRGSCGTAATKNAPKAIRRLSP